MKRLAMFLAVFAFAGCSHMHMGSSGSSESSSSGGTSSSGYSSSGSSGGKTASDAYKNGNGNDLYVRNGAATGVYVPDSGTYGYGGP